MIAFNDRPKRERFNLCKTAYFHQFNRWLTVPFLLVVIASLVSAIIQGTTLGILFVILILLVSLTWANYTGFHAMWVCKKAGIDYNNKPWDEV